MIFGSSWISVKLNHFLNIAGEPFVPIIAQAVDLFPNTHHCELVVLFERKVSEFAEIQPEEETTQGVKSEEKTE